MLPAVRNLFADPGGSGEEFATLHAGGKFRLEQIVSRGEASAEGFWYDQREDEWVVLLRGTSTLEFEDGWLDLVAGDALCIPARCRHRVAATSPDAVWVALHFAATDCV